MQSVWRVTALLVGGALFSGCAVAMAARTGGVKLEEVQACQTRDCFLNKDSVQIIQVAKLQSGETMESYRFQLKRGSAGRAAMHGLLDVATIGVWEVAGTPIEATKDKKYVTVTATYSTSGAISQTFLGIPTLPAGAELLAVPAVASSTDIDS